MKPSQITNLLNVIDDFLEMHANAPESKDLDLVSLRDKLRAIHDEKASSLIPMIKNQRMRSKLLFGKERAKWFQDWTWSEERMEIFKSIMKAHVNWEYPCMEVFPGTGDSLPHALAAEPLYIVDWEETLLDRVGKQFNDYYATKRLMKYKINEYDFSELPKNSFGFIYAVNWVRFEDITGLNNLALGLYDCLMPGGHLLMAYNPIDRAHGIQNTEEGYAAGADTGQLRSALESIGFEIREIQNKIMPSYVLCKKPGEIEYIKAGSILAKIIDRNQEV
jgi:hypothetical protein